MTCFIEDIFYQSSTHLDDGLISLRRKFCDNKTRLTPLLFILKNRYYEECRIDPMLFICQRLIHNSTRVTKSITFLLLVIDHTTWVSVSYVTYWTPLQQDDTVGFHFYMFKFQYNKHKPFTITILLHVLRKKSLF